MPRLRAEGVGTFAATVLARRGIADPPRAGRLPRSRPIAGLNDPRLLPDADAAARPGRAAPATRGERVMVFGDFDADGLTGLAQLVLALRRLGIETTPYVPSRLDEGHGLSLAAVEAAAARPGSRSSSRSTRAPRAWPRSPRPARAGST